MVGCAATSSCARAPRGEASSLAVSSAACCRPLPAGAALPLLPSLRRSHRRPPPPLGWKHPNIVFASPTGRMKGNDEEDEVPAALPQPSDFVQLRRYVDLAAAAVQPADEGAAGRLCKAVKYLILPLWCMPGAPSAICRFQAVRAGQLSAEPNRTTAESPSAESDLVAIKTDYMELSISCKRSLCRSTGRARIAERMNKVKRVARPSPKTLCPNCRRGFN